MNGRTHMAVALLSSVAVAVVIKDSKTLFDLSVYPWMLPLCAIAGGLNSDVDINDNVVKGAKLPLWIIRHIPGMKKVFAHRGITHTLLVPGLVYFLALTLGASDGSWASKAIISSLLGFIVGYLSHVISDALNGHGVPFLFPTFFKRIHILNISTGTLEEWMFLIVFIVLMISNIALVYTGNTL